MAERRSSAAAELPNRNAELLRLVGQVLLDAGAGEGHDAEMRSFEVLVARAANEQGQEVVFSSMPAEADRRVRQLHLLLRGLGATATTTVTILSAGPQRRASAPGLSAGSQRRSGRPPVPGWGGQCQPRAPRSGLDFHLSMRIQHVAQAVNGWATALPAAAERMAALADVVTRLRWRLWHGQTERALALIGTLLTDQGSVLETADNRPARKVAALLHDLETYAASQADLIIDYATARRRGEPISTTTTESPVQRLLHRRMGADQQMRWSPRGAHRMLKVRTAMMNGTLASDHAATEPYARQPFHRAA